MRYFRYAVPVVLMTIAAYFGAAGVTRAQAPDGAAGAVRTLPPVFQPGATLLCPMGKVSVEEIWGEWIRIKSLHPLAGPEDQWLYVPAMSGTWILDQQEKKR
jgi:hypothetical protein